MTDQLPSPPETPSSDSSETPADGSAPPASYFTQPEVDDAVPITSPAPLPVGQAPSYSRKVGEGDAEQVYAASTPEEAASQLEKVAAFCKDCPIWHHCPEEACAVYRAEMKLIELVDDETDERYFGVDLAPDVQP